MSTSLAIAAVTSVLKDLLGNRLVERNVTDSVGDVTVSAIPPDRVPTGADERNQLNLFLYRMTPHTRWRPQAPGAPVGDEAMKKGSAVSRQPLTLDLHYLLTAYGEHDAAAELLLGHAVQLMHETPVLAADAIKSGLGSIARNGSSGVQGGTRAVLARSTLADQVEEITIVPEFLS